jgi:hypothetical protein
VPVSSRLPSDFNAERGSMVRSEGARIYCDFNNVSERTGEKGSDQTQSCLSRFFKSLCASHSLLRTARQAALATAH